MQWARRGEAAAGAILANGRLQLLQGRLDTRAPPPPLLWRPHHSLSPTFLANNQGLVLAAEGATALAGRGGGDVMDS